MFGSPNLQSLLNVLYMYRIAIPMTIREWRFYMSAIAMDPNGFKKLKKKLQLPNHNVHNRKVILYIMYMQLKHFSFLSSFSCLVFFSTKIFLANRKKRIFRFTWNLKHMRIETWQTMKRISVMWVLINEIGTDANICIYKQRDKRWNEVEMQQQCDNWQ